MTDFKTSSYKFLNRVSNSSRVRDSRETGANSFKQVLQGTKNNKNKVQVEFEGLKSEKLYANIRPGQSKNVAIKNTLWSKA